MSKFLLFGSLVVAAAIAAPASRAEPPPFPNPSPTPKDAPPEKPGDPAAPAPKDAPAPAPKDTPESGSAPAPDARAVAAFAKDLHWTRWTGQALKYEVARFLGEARLYARSKDRTGWQVFRGPDLDTILRASPTLASHPELPALREHLAGPTEVRVVIQGYTLGYEQNPDTGEVNVFGRGPRGETMWSGADIDAIAAENADLKQVQEWPQFEARVREVAPLASTVRIRPGLSGVAVLTYSPRDVAVTLHWWRERGWMSRTYRGSSLPNIAQANADVARVLDLGAAANAQPAMPAPYAAPYPPPGATPPATPPPATPSTTTPAPAPTPRYQPPSTPPAGGGGTACGGGGKACGGSR